MIAPLAPRCFRFALAATLCGALALGACGSTPPPPPSSLFVDPTAAAEAKQRAEADALVLENQQRGWECGYGEAWERSLMVAREQTPLRWRSTTLGAVLTVGLFAFAIGLVGLLLLALLLPRLRRGSAGDEDDDRPSHGVLAFFRTAATRALDGLARLLRVEIFDRHAADARVSASHEARDARRIIAAVTVSVQAVSSEGSARGGELVQALAEWSADLAALSEHLEGHGPWAPRLDPGPLVGRLVKTRRAAQQLRLECARAEIAGTVPDDAAWATWRQLVDGRPNLPLGRSARVRDARRGPLPTWVRPTGWAGVAALALAIPLSAAWTAAGAFPLFFVLLFCLGGLGATFAARIWLFRHGRRPLLPGLADRIARTLTWMALLTTLLVVASSMTASESGLDLGDPPPVERPAEQQVPPLPTALGTVAPEPAANVQPMALPAPKLQPMALPAPKLQPMALPAPPLQPMPAPAPTPEAAPTTAP